MTDYYQILGVSRSASLMQIKKAFRQKAKKLHPDVNSSAQAHESFSLLNEAYQVLTDVNKKTIYDLKLNNKKVVNTKDPQRKQHRYTKMSDQQADFHYDWNSFNKATQKTKDLRHSHPFLFHSFFIFGMLVGFILITVFLLGVMSGELHILFLAGIIPSIIIIIEGFNGIIGKETSYTKMVNWIMGK